MVLNNMLTKLIKIAIKRNMLKEASILYKYAGQCLLCGDKKAYEGLEKVECSTMGCPNYSEKWAQEIKNKNKEKEDNVLETLPDAIKRIITNPKSAANYISVAYLPRDLGVPSLGLIDDSLPMMIRFIWFDTLTSPAHKEIVFDRTGKVIFDNNDMKKLLKDIPLDGKRPSIDEIEEWLINNKYIK